MSESFEKWWWDYDNGGLHCYDDCKAAHTAGLIRAAEIAEDMPSSASMYAKSNEAMAANQIRLAIAAAIRKEAGE